MIGLRGSKDWIDMHPLKNKYLNNSSLEMKCMETKLNTISKKRKSFKKKYLLLIGSSIHPVHKTYVYSLKSRFIILKQADFVQDNIFFKLCKQLWAIKKYIKKQINVVFTEKGAGIFFAYLLKLVKPKIRWVHLVADTLPYELNKNHLKKILYKIILKRVNFFIFVSDMVKNDIKKHIKMKNNFIVCHPYLQHEKSLFNYETTRKENKNFLFIGRLDKDKNPLLTLEVFKHLLKYNPRCTLTILGKGRLESKIINFITKNNLRNKVFFVGWVKEPKFFYKNSDFLIHLAEYDPHPCVTLEAMAAGVLPIISNKVGTRYLVPKKLILNLKIKNPKRIAQKIMKIITDNPKKLNALRRSLRKKASDYTKKNLVASFQNKFFSFFDKR